MQGVAEKFIGSNGEASLSGRALIKRAQVPRPEHVSTVTPRHRMLAEAELAQRIEEGTVDIGPLTHHDPVVGMHSDQRDPTGIGRAIFNAMLHSDDPASVVFDNLVRRGAAFENYQEEFTDHSKLRQAELQKRADEGDRFAAALLAGDTLAEEPVD